MYVYKKSVYLNNILGINAYVTTSVISMSIYMLAIYQTPVLDLDSVFDLEYLTIGLKYLFGPSVLYISAIALWEKENNQKLFLRVLIFLNILLVFVQMLNGVKTGFILGSLHSNQMGAIAAISIGMVFIFKAFNQGNAYLRKVLLLCACIALVMSLSRGAFFSVIISLIAYLVLSKSVKYKKLKILIGLLILSINVFISVDFNNMLKSDIGRGVSVSIEDVTGKDVLENGRIKLWNQAIYLLEDSPIVGIGVNARRSWTRELGDGTQLTLSIHNYYLAVLLEAGLIGFLCILWLVASLITLTQKYSTGVAKVSFALIVGVLVYQLTEVSLTTGTLMVGFLAWFTFGIGIRLSYVMALNQRSIK